jgi:hypothetical protein
MLSLAGWLVFTPAVGAQPPAKPAAQAAESGFHRMTIYNGAMPTAHYFAAGGSTGEQAGLRDLERAEHEAALADQLMALRRQYLTHESQLENYRAAMQRLYYGYASISSYGAWPYGYGYGVAPYGAAALGPFPPTAYAGLGYGGGLAWGGLDEGPLKRDIAQTLAAQATPEHSGQAYRQLHASLARVRDSSSRVAPAAGTPDKGGVRLALYEPAAPEDFRLAKRGAHIIVTRKLGDTTDKVEGTVVSENGDWLVLDTKAGRRTIARSQIVDVLEPNK